MKTRVLSIFLILLLCLTAGCGKASQNTEKPDGFSFSESQTEEAAGKDTSQAEQTAPAQPPEAQSAQTADEETEGSAESERRPVPEHPVSGTTPPQTSDPQQKKDESERRSETTASPAPSETEQPIPPATEEPKPSEPPQPTQPSTEPPTEPSFDIGYWVNFAKSYAESVGLTLDSGAAYRFVTEETFDAYLYQLVEGKQKFASQIMTSKSPVRSCEDIDETALSYAEIKMLATGNPHIKEKMDLDIQVQKLRLLKSSFLSEKYALEDKIIKFYPQEIARRSDVIAGLKSDIERVAEHPKPSDETFVGMTVKGAFYSEKADAGNAILEACKAMTNPEPIPLGEYRGFTMELYFEAREYKVRLKGELGYPVTLGTDTFGNITRLDNALEGLPKRLEMNEMELDNIKKQFETAKVDVERPFPQEEELKTKTDRLNELNALLNVDKRENEIVGGEPDEGEEPPEKKPRDLER